jgi:tetratricopeptide (TPR) repeat protein
VLLWQTSRPGEAAEACRATIARTPDHAEAHYLLGTVLRQQGDSDGAIAEFRETIRIQPASAEAHLSLGQALRRKGERDASAAALAEAERLNRKKVDRQAATFAMDLGKRRLGEGDVQGGVASLREAVRLAPDLAEAHLQLALALERQGASTEALQHFEEARRLAPYLRTQLRAAGRPSAALPIPHP